MDVIPQKWQAFADKQVKLRAARQAKESSLALQGERMRQIMEQSKPAPIRIKLIVQLEDTFLDAVTAKRLKEQLAPGAVNIIQKYIEVLVPRKYAIRMPKPDAEADSYCNDAWASALWEKGGVKGYDLVMYITANQTKDCRQGALAYTLPCMTDMVTGRPIAAGMNICPLSRRSSPRRLLNTLVHEMVHALGFSGQLFPLYYDSRTWNPYKRSEQVAVEYASDIQGNGTKASAMYIAFPAIKALAQQHFKCDKLPGAPADVGSFASHFKQRLSGHELMMPATSEDGAIKSVTNFTLTLLDSTGWYSTRKDLAQPALFGAGAGCDLAMGPCNTFIEKNPQQNLYCTANRLEADQCTHDYEGIGVCVEGLDDGCLLAGASQLRGFTVTCTSTSTWSTMRHQAYFYNHAMFGGTVGTRDSRCFEIESSSKACMKRGPAKGDTCLMRQAMCLETRCDSRGMVQAVFKFPDGREVAVDCPSGTSLDLAKQLPGRGFTSGKLRCPNAQQVCPTVGCKQPCVHGMCYRGRCICDMEYTGNRCDVALVQGLT
eukprot:gene5454-5688_t